MIMFACHRPVQSMVNYGHLNMQQAGCSLNTDLTQPLRREFHHLPDTDIPPSPSLLSGNVALRHFSATTRQRYFNYTCKQTLIVIITLSAVHCSLMQQNVFLSLRPFTSVIYSLLVRVTSMLRSISIDDKNKRQLVSQLAEA